MDSVVRLIYPAEITDRYRISPEKNRIHKDRKGIITKGVVLFLYENKKQKSNEKGRWSVHDYPSVLQYFFLPLKKYYKTIT